MNKKIVLISVSVLTVLLLVGGIIFFFSGGDSGKKVAAEKTKSQSEVIVYETPVDSAEDCSSYEEFDSATSTCFFECEDEIECEEISQAIDDELASLLDDYENGNQNSESSDASTDENVVAKYRVKKGETIELFEGEESEEDISLWNQIKSISPNDFSDRYIETFEVFENQDDDTLAFVFDGDGNGKFDIAINVPQHAASSLSQQTLTIVHELGHIVTLNSDEISGESCGGYTTDEGCFANDSILGGYVKRFWSDSQIEASKNGGVEFSESNFVTEYATSSPEEDIAESFAFYVVNSNVNDSNVASQKQAYFDQFEDVVAIKKSMRQAIAKDVIRKRKG